MNWKSKIGRLSSIKEKQNGKKKKQILSRPINTTIVKWELPEIA